MTRPMLKAESETVARSAPHDGIDALARFVWAHGLADGVRAMEALAATVINCHHQSPGRTLSQITKDPALFPAHDLDDGLARIDSRDPTFAMALRVARRAVSGAGADLVAGATRFHAIGDRPEWSTDKTPVALIGRLMFYR